MSEPRKNHLSINGGQDNEDENVSSYKPIPETDTEFRTSKNNLAKSKEKISPDGAEEKLLPKEEEAKIVTRVDMADAKYVVEDHRNGDAKIELDANKRQFSGLSKEELMKYADDPFWVNLRWFMFILFWAMWLCMLAGAITIIIKAPKCPLQPPRTWFEAGPLLEMGDATYDDIEVELPKMQSFLVQGIFVDVPTYEYEKPTVMESFKKFAAKAKEYGIKVIADLIPNYVGIDHVWFRRSVQKDSNYTDYFVWHAGKADFDENQTQPKLPTDTWKSTLHDHPWTFNTERNAYYLHQYGVNQPDLNFTNERVVQEFDKVIRSWMKAGAAGVRLNKARLLLVNSTLPEEHIATGKGMTPGLIHYNYNFWQHKHTMDLPLLDVLLTRWAGVVDSVTETPGEAVFTLAEEGEQKELFMIRNLSSLRPPMTAPLSVAGDLTKLAADMNLRLRKWPALQLNSSFDGDEELAVFSILLPASPVLEPHQLRADNDTAITESLSHLIPLRADAALQHGHAELRAVPERDSSAAALLACARWKAGKSGYVAVYNPSDESRRANLTDVTSLPATLTVHHMSHAARLLANQTNTSESVDDVFVPPRSTVILSYVPKIEVEQ
ncbi:unnamed protein product [Arctia plantaginis]|uniref:alpha-glucosidase n=1 Tax=Arctia plantaginis TaxID=874455 RepID=A0A8S1AUM5_ARCPL|nr:unnamed protein product [Arctia plantaginis]